jgi:hypothetical protein
MRTKNRNLLKREKRRTKEFYLARENLNIFSKSEIEREGETERRRNNCRKQTMKSMHDQGPILRNFTSL